MAGAPYGNKNAEKWTLEAAEELYKDALNMSMEDDYDFIGEVARDLGTYRDIFTDLKDKFQSLKGAYNQLLTNLEANCFTHAKKGKIKEASALMNLKANYDWKDRQSIETPDLRTIKGITFD
jgi:hypothetical protein